MPVFKSIKEIGKGEFVKKAEQSEAAWLGRHSNFNFFFKARSSGGQIKKLLMYHNAIEDEYHKREEYEKIYRPLGITETEYLNRNFTIEEVTIRINQVGQKIFEFPWYAEIRKKGMMNKIDLVKYPVFVREIANDGFEIVDANHRLIAKLLYYPYEFGCTVYIMCNKHADNLP